MIKGIIFDLNGTLIDIATDEWSEEVYRVTANFLRFWKAGRAFAFRPSTKFTLRRSRTGSFSRLRNIRLHRRICLRIWRAGKTAFSFCRKNR